MEHLRTLNPAQREAVEATDGPVLILAGAGAGKTRVITHRILQLVLTGVDPTKILAVTFTNKAAKEMRGRVMKLLADSPEYNRPVRETTAPYVATFHGLGVRILKENAWRAGLTRHFAIADRSDAIRFIKEAEKRAGFDPKQLEPRRVLGAISRAKGDAQTLSEYREQTGGEYFPEAVAEVWGHYETLLQNAQTLDFDDLLLKTKRLLEQHPDIQQHYRDQFHFVHVDEYQDTNRVQFHLVRLLVGDRNNICVVGDVDQNIYSWRGATIENLLSFEKQWPDARTFILEQNYRSTKTILEAANTIIEKNVNRPEKHLFTDNDAGEQLIVYGAYDETDEAAFVARTAEQLIREGQEPKEIAVLYRTNFQSRALEEAMLIADIPYQVLGTRFFERKEVKDVIAYIRAARNPENMAEIKRIINVPTRGIGKVTFLKIAEGRREQLQPAMKKRVDGFFDLLGAINKTLHSEKPSTSIKHIIQKTGIEGMYAGGDEDDLERLANVHELVTLASKYDHLTPEEGIEKLLEDAALATDQDELLREQNAVRLSTVHAAKGLEFDTVFVTGLEEGLFPHEGAGAHNEKRDEEEERRLFYVALTRARHAVYLTYAAKRTIFGNTDMTVPSSFLTDIDERFLAPADYAEREEPARTIYLDE